MTSLADFDRLPLGLLPTPLHPLPHLSAELGVEVWVKRDDLTGLGLGGNKVRKLEFLLAAAQAADADIILTTGGPQSNHAMLTAAACRRLGLDCELVLKQRGVLDGGNVLLDELIGVPITWVDTDGYDDVYAVMDARVAELQSAGRRPYLIPVGGSVPLGSLGYVACVAEIAEQAAAAGVDFDHIVCATGSGGTQAGLTVGAAIHLPTTPVTGYDVGVGGDPAPVIAELINGTAELLGHDLRIAPTDVRVHDALGPGYSKPSESGVAGMQLMARTEGLILDPVYSGKAFGGLVDGIRAGQYAPGSRVLFVHTGGAGGLFAVGTQVA